jgi:anthranilate phosphoribosyltransferase
MSAMTPALAALARSERPAPAALDSAFAAILAGQADPAQTGAFLMGLEALALTADAVVAGATAMRAAMTRLEVPFETMDVCGTGGDGAHSLNISTAVSFVVAAAGVKVAKHGNRAMSSKSGAGDVLEALGVVLTPDPGLLRKALDEAGIAFLFAQNHHKAMAHVAPVRRALGFRTVFNLLGPLSNPAGASRQLVGVFAPERMMVMAQALSGLGCTRAMVLCGAGGVDEAVLHGPTEAVELVSGTLSHRTIDPEQLGLTPAPISALAGGDAAFNAAAMLAMLDGQRGAYRDAVVLNAALALVVAGNVGRVEDGIVRASLLIDNGAARRALDLLVSITGRQA